MASLTPDALLSLANECPQIMTEAQAECDKLPIEADIERELLLDLQSRASVLRKTAMCLRAVKGMK